MTEKEFWQYAKPFMLILRIAFLQVVRDIEKRYNLRSE